MCGAVRQRDKVAQPAWDLPACLPAAGDTQPLPQHPATFFCFRGRRPDPGGKEISAEMGFLQDLTP